MEAGKEREHVAGHGVTEEQPLCRNRTRGIDDEGNAGGAKPAGPPGPQLTFAQAKLVPVTVGLQTDVSAEVSSPSIAAGTLVITTRPDSLQDKSTVAMSAPVQGAGQTAR